MNLFDYIRDWFIKATNFFYQLADEAYDSWYVPDAMGDWFSDLSTFTSRVAGYLFDAANWYDDVEDRLNDILSWANIKNRIKDWLPDLEDAIDWFTDWVDQVADLVSDWWETMSGTVKGWISTAVDAFQGQIDDVNSWLTTLQETVDGILDQIPDVSAILDWFADWTGNVLGVINTWWDSTVSDVQALINTAFEEHADFWDGWSDWRDQVVTFFTDPEDWLYQAVDRIIERFW